MSEVPLYSRDGCRVTVRHRNLRLPTRCIPTTVYVQGSLAHKKQPLPRTLHYDYTQGPMVVLGVGAVSYERGGPVCTSRVRHGGSLGEFLN